MSGRQEKATAGYPLTDQDLQRAWDAGAEADSIMDEALFTPPNTFNSSPAYTKAIVPLGYEFQASAFSPNPALIVIPSASFGTALVAKAFRAIAALQAQGGISGVPTLPTINPASVGPAQVAATGLSCDYNPITPFNQLVSAGDPSHPRIDTLAVVLTRGTSVSGNRQFKDPTSGNVSEQSLTLATDPSVGFAYIPGTASGSPVPPTLLGDTSTTWFIALANFFIPAGFNPATTLLGNGGSYIQQVWRRGGIDPRRVNGYTPASGNGTLGASGVVVADTVFQRWSSQVRFGVALTAPVTATSTLATLDATIDWRNRHITITVSRPFDAGSGVRFPPPEQLASAGVGATNTSIGYLMSGPGNTSHVVGSLGPASWSFAVDTSGNLQCTTSVNATDATNGDTYYIEITATPQFIGPQV